MPRLVCAFFSFALTVTAAAAAQPVLDSGASVPRPSRASVPTPPGTGVGFPQYPAVSPDGSLITFTWAGDIWCVPYSGGCAARLSAHPADERRTSFSPDGGVLAFESNRDGARNLYVAPLYVPRNGETAGVALGTAVRVTTSDQSQTLGGFLADGSALLFTSNREPAVYRAPRAFRVELTRDELGTMTGGGAVSRAMEAFGNLVRPSLASKDGSLVFSRGLAGSERPKYRGSGNQDLARYDGSSHSYSVLTKNAANDTDGWELPDGSVVFVSSRDGQNNVWRIPKGGSDADAIQLTRFAPTAEERSIGHGVRDLAVSADGRHAVFVVWNRLYGLDLKSDTPPRAIEVFAAADSAVAESQRLNLDKEVSDQAISPDGKTLAVIARGEIFVRSTQEGYPTRRVTNTAGRERDLAWSPDGRVLYFASDEANQMAGAGGGVNAIYSATVVLAREDLDPKTVVKKPDEEAVKDAKAAEGKGEKKADHGKRWAESLTFKVEPLIVPGANATEDARHPIPSPDGKKLLFTRGRGDLVLMDLQTKSERTLLASWDEADAVWASDSRHIVYSVSDLDFNSDIWLMDTQGSAEPVENGRRWRNPVNLTQHPDLDHSPRLSADGKVLTFLSDRAGENWEFDVWAVNLDRAIDSMTGYERDEYFKKAAEAASKRKPLGAPVASGSKPAKKEPEGSDDKANEEQEGDGEKAAEKGPEEKDKDKERDAAKPAEAPLEFDAEDAYRRVRRITSMPGAESNLAMTPGGDRILFAGSADGERALMSVDFKGQDRKVLQSGGVSGVTVSLTGDKASFIRSGQVFTVNPKAGGKVEGLPVDAPVTIEIAAQQRQKFLEAANVIGSTFYHPTLKGLDWNALTARYLTLAEGTRTNDEFNRVMMQMFGELDGSHLGIWGGASPFSAPPVSTGYLGIFARPAPGGFRVEHVAADTPADAKGVRLRVGDLIEEVDGQRLAADGDSLPNHDLDAALAGSAGKETLIRVRRAEPGEGKPAEQLLLMVPMSFGLWDTAQYWDEVGHRQKKVEQLSGGRLGYLHIRAMGEGSVRDFERDLFAAANGKDGLIIDVRDNGGGSTADILLASLTAPNHAYTQPRGVDPKDVPKDAYPRDRRVIYAWTRPINVLINQNSFSNAEIFAHAIKTTGRGRLVGTATFGGVISTGATSLIDGTMVRTPGRGWYLPDGTDMENHGAQPDVDVPQMPEDEATGRDRQLEAAVEDLLRRIDGK